MTQAQVTVGLFAYNQERFVQAALDGVYAQTHRPFRLVICDDGSTDATRSKLEDKLRSCPADIEVVRIYSDVNLGVGGIINHASAHFVGRTLVFMAGDDVSEPERVASAHQAIGTGAAFHYTAVRKMDAEGAFLQQADITQDAECTVADFTSGKMPPIIGASCSYSMDVFTFFGPIDVGLMQEDVILPLRGLLLGAGRFDGRPLVRYRTHATNLFSPSHRQSSTEMAYRNLRFAPSRAAFCRQLRRDLDLFEATGFTGMSTLMEWLRAESEYSKLEMGAVAAECWLGKARFILGQFLKGNATIKQTLKLCLLHLAPFFYGPALKIWVVTIKR